jgi:hypothetical protein
MKELFFDILAYLIVAVAFVFAIRKVVSLFFAKKNKKTCNSNSCSGCSLNKGAVETQDFVSLQHK